MLVPEPPHQPPELELAETGDITVALSRAGLRTTARPQDAQRRRGLAGQGAAERAAAILHLIEPAEELVNAVFLVRVGGLALVREAYTSITITSPTAEALACTVLAASGLPTKVTEPLVIVDSDEFASSVT